MAADAGAVAVIIELLGNPRGIPVRFTCAEATTIPKGTLLKLTDPRTAIATSADNDPFCGIAAAEKVGGDGSTTIAAYTFGIFDLITTSANPNVLAGERVSIGGENMISKVADTDILFSNVGTALESATDAAQETIAVLVGGMGY